MDLNETKSTRDIELIRLLIQWPATTVGYLYHKGDIPSLIEGTDLIVPVLSQNNPFISAVVDRMMGSNDNDNSLTVVPLTKDLHLAITPAINYRVRTFPITIPITDLTGNDKSTTAAIYSDMYTNNQLINAVLLYLNHQVKLLTLPPAILYSSIVPEMNKSIQITPVLPTDLGSLSQFLMELGPPWGVTHQVAVGEFNSSATLIDPQLLRSLIVQLTCQLDQLHQLVGFRGGGLLASSIAVQNSPLEADYRGVNLISPLTCHIIDFSRASVILSTGNRILTLGWDSQLSKVKTLRIGPEIPHNTYGVDYRTNHKHGSWDYYTLLCSMILIPSVYYRWFSDPELINDLWVPLWRDHKQAADVQKIFHAALRDDRPSTLETITCLLQPYVLKDDLVQQQLNRWIP